MVQWVLVRDILCGGSNKTYKLAFMAVLSIKVVIAYFLTLAPISVVNKS